MVAEKIQEARLGEAVGGFERVEGECGGAAARLAPR
jgi:hypothetical protein